MGGHSGRRPTLNTASGRRTRHNHQQPPATMAISNVCWRVCVWCVLVLTLCGFSHAAPAQVCAGGVADDDPRAQRFCQALNTFLELYAEAAGEQVPQYQALVREYPQLLDTGMKRQDVVHSFLRFGRRR